MNTTEGSASSLMDDDAPDISMENLYPALIQCFGIIICGYIAGRLNIISNSGAKGFNTYVGTFALPSLIFLSLSTIDWQTVNWKFLLAILVSKAIAFFAVMLITLLVVRPLNYGKAGILAIFCTQSNDFAIGFPIVEALYSNIHPEYSAYVYLMAPISLAILNPIGYVLMEISSLQKKNEDVPTPAIGPPCHQPQQPERKKLFQGKCLVIIKVIKSIILNPILLMTLLGILGRLVFTNGLPIFIKSILTVLANSFAGTALFLLGVRMVGKAHKLQGSGFLLPGILIIVKLLVLPLVIRQTVNITNAGANFSDTTDLSTFGFLYGTFPAAPGVFVIASGYNTDVDLIASSMVACTFVSAPLMFISAKMISITKLNPSDYLNELDKFALDISVLAIGASVILLIFFGITRKFMRFPHRITCCLLTSQLIGSIGVILWSKLGQEVNWQMYLQFAFFTIGQYSSRLFTSFLAITLLFLNSRSLCFVLKLWPAFLLLGFGVPCVVTGLLLIFDHKKIISPKEKSNPSFQFGNAQAAISVFLLVMCFLVTVGCLILHQRYKKRFEKYMTLSKEVSTPEGSETATCTTNSTMTVNDPNNGSNANVNFSINTTRRRRTSYSSSDDENALTDQKTNCGEGNELGCCTRTSTATTVVDIEDLLPKRLSTNRNNDDDVPTNGLCSTQFNCASTSREACHSLVQRYQDQSQYELEPIEYDETVDSYQVLKHTVLLILLLCSMFVSFALSLWTLVMEGMSGIYVELCFLDGFLNFGQSLIVLACFISDTGELFTPINNLWRKIWYGANILKLESYDDLSNETKLICEQFQTYHLQKAKLIAQDKRWRIKVYKKVFYGSTFVDWLIEVGLARDRVDAIKYGKCLVDGRILRHINNVHHFNDKKLLYTFCSRL